MKKATLILSLAAVLFLSCSKEDDAGTSPIPPVSDTPLIEGITMDPIAINQFGSVTLYITYKDGNGDLGDEDADEHALEVVDMRDSILHTFHVPPQSPIPDISISGVIQAEIKNIILLDQNNTSETAYFRVRLRDRSMNWSAERNSPDLVISK